MSEQTIQEALKQAGAPDYMVIIITEVVQAKDAIREMQAALSKGAVEQRQDRIAFEQRQAALDERQAAFLQGVQDMHELANRIYGPDSDLAKIKEELALLQQRVANVEADQRESA